MSMWDRKLKGCKVASSNPTPKEELERNHKELQEMIASGWKPAIKPKRQRVKSSEVKTPKKVIVTSEGCDWALTVSWEYYLKKGGKAKIVTRIY